MKAEKFNHPLLNMMNSPSSAADVWTRKQPETDTENKEPVDNKTVDIPPVHTYDELKKMRRNAYIKLAAIVGIIVTALAFGSVAWFTQSREVEGSAVQMTASGENFKISSPTNENSSAGLWYNPYHKKIIGNITENDTDIPSGVWLMTDEANFGNYQSSIGIKPGSYGKVTFNVTPLVDEIDLQFTFDVIGYHSSDSTFSNENESSELTLTPVASMGSKGADIAEYLNGHILLFENRTPVYETTIVTDPETGEETITNTQNILRYVYSGLIETDEDMKRVLKNTAKTQFSGKNTERPVDIYWIWPNTLGTLIDVSSRDDVQEIPLCTGDELTKVTNYVLSHPQYFFKGYITSTSDDPNDETVSGSSLTLEAITDDYEIYGDMYDMADNDIGMNVNYILLKLTATENTTNTGSGSDDDTGNEGENTPNP